MNFAVAWTEVSQETEPTTSTRPDPFWIGLFLCLVDRQSQSEP